VSLPLSESLPSKISHVQPQLTDAFPIRESEQLGCNTLVLGLSVLIAIGDRFQFAGLCSSCSFV